MSKAKLFHGPRKASYSVDYLCPDGSRGSASTMNRASAHWECAYYIARGYVATIMRTELCNAPLCRGHFAETFAGKPCKAHMPEQVTVEWYEPTIARECGLYASESERISMALHNDIPLEILGWITFDEARSL